LVLLVRELKRMLARVARELPAATVVLVVLSAIGMGCAHEGRSVWVEDLPSQAAASEPKIHPGDTLLVEVQKQPTLSGEFVVREDGHYAQPLVGSIDVAEKTPSQVASAVSAALHDVVVDPVVSVWISKPSIKVSVVGEVRAPGLYELTRDHSLISALAVAGWLTEFAHSDRIFVVRIGARERIRFRVSDLTSAESRFARFQLADSDVVVVE
jgi:polysaccharide export outer membrane protein